jgi:hypothetical protein
MKRDFVRMADNFQKVIPFSIAICDCNFPHARKSNSIPYIKQPLMILVSLEWSHLKLKTPRAGVRVTSFVNENGEIECYAGSGKILITDETRRSTELTVYAE